MSEPPPNKPAEAQPRAAARAAGRAAREAAALRANLRRRKQHPRAQLSPPDAAPKEPPDKCR